MSIFKVYNSTKYDITIDRHPIHEPKGTREAIQRKGLQVLEETETEVDSSRLDDEGFVKPLLPPMGGLD